MPRADAEEQNRPPSDDAQKRLYARLIANDKTARLDLLDQFFLPLLAALQRRYGKDAQAAGDEGVIENKIYDTLLDVAKLLEKFDPKRGSLWGYLYGDAQGDILNELARLRREGRYRSLVEASVVEETVEDRNVHVERVALERVESRLETLLPVEVSLKTVMEGLRKIVKTPQDAEILHLMLDGESSTQSYAAILGIESQPIDEQRREVKRHKDRLGLRLKRLGKELLTP